VKIWGRVTAVLILSGVSCLGQVSYFNQGFLRQPSAELDRLYLGITNSSGGSGSVTNFAIGNFSPLFTTGVTDPTTFPTVAFSAISQNQNLVYASPNGAPGTPSFRALVAADFPSAGTVTSFSSGNLSPLFTTSVANPTTTPALSFNLSSQSANLVFAGPTGGGAAAPTFRSLVSADIPSLGYLTSITNASPSLGTTLISESNAPIPSIKSVSAGGNVSITDNKTNIIISASPTVSGGGLDLFAWQTNYLTTYRTVANDASSGSAFTMNGFGDNFASSGNGSAVLLQSTDNSLGQGPWIQMLTGATSGNSEFIGTSTANIIFPYTNAGFSFQTLLKVRNNTSVRIWVGFMTGTFAQYEGVDTITTNTVAFRFSTAAGDTTWQAFCSDGVTATVADTGATVSADGNYYLQFFKTNGTSSVVFVVNRGTPTTISTSVPTTVTTVGTTTMGVSESARTLTSANRTNLIRYIGYTQDWSTK